jgi:hypothetical protein
VAYSFLAAYPTVLWLILNWQIMGNPLYFLADARGGINVAQIDLGGDQLTPAAAFRVSADIWAATFPVGVLASLAVVAIGVYQRSLALVGLGLLPLSIPLLQGVLLSRKANVLLVRYFIMVVPLGFMLLFVALQPILDHWRRPTAGQVARPLLLASVAVLIVASSVSSAVVLATNPNQDIERNSWLALTTDQNVGRLEQGRDITEGIEVGRLLTRLVPAGSKVLLDPYGYGFAVILGAREHDLFVDHTDPRFERALLNPPPYVDYVLTQSPEGRGALTAINQFQPTLWAQGAPWAERVEGLPPTHAGWRLYKVRR